MPSCSNIQPIIKSNHVKALNGEPINPEQQPLFHIQTGITEKAPINKKEGVVTKLTTKGEEIQFVIIDNKTKAFLGSDREVPLNIPKDFTNIKDINKLSYALDKHFIKLFPDRLDFSVRGLGGARRDVIRPDGGRDSYFANKEEAVAAAISDARIVGGVLGSREIAEDGGNFSVGVYYSASHIGDYFCALKDHTGGHPGLDQPTSHVHVRRILEITDLSRYTPQQIREWLNANPERVFLSNIRCKTGVLVDRSGRSSVYRGCSDHYYWPDPGPAPRKVSANFRDNIKVRGAGLK